MSFPEASGSNSLKLHFSTGEFHPNKLPSLLAEPSASFTLMPNSLVGTLPTIVKLYESLTFLKK